MKIQKKSYTYHIDDSRVDLFPVTLENFKSGDFVEIWYDYTLDVDTPGYEAGETRTSYSLKKYKFNSKAKNTPIRSNDVHNSYVAKDLKDLNRIVMQEIPSWATNINIKCYSQNSLKVTQGYKNESLTYICDCCYQKFKMKHFEYTLEKLIEHEPYNQQIFKANEYDTEHYCYKCLDRPIGVEKTLVNLLITDMKLSETISTTLRNNDWNVDSVDIPNSITMPNINISINRDKVSYTENMFKQLEAALNITIVKQRSYKIKNSSLNAKIHEYIVQGV